VDPDRLVPARTQHDLLNEPQRRRFHVFLELLEKSLNEVERLASWASVSPSGSLIVYRSDAPPDFLSRSAPVIQRLREDASALAETLEIVPTPRSQMNAIRAILTAEFVRVDDTFSSKLVGYGPVSSRLRIEVDPQLASIRAHLKMLLANLNASSLERPSSDAPEHPR
jgi:hypothetical protein